MINDEFFCRRITEQSASLRALPHKSFKKLQYFLFASVRRRKKPWALNELAQKFSRPALSCARLQRKRSARDRKNPVKFFGFADV